MSGSRLSGCSLGRSSLCGGSILSRSGLSGCSLSRGGLGRCSLCGGFLRRFFLNRGCGSSLSRLLIGLRLSSRFGLLNLLLSRLLHLLLLGLSFLGLVLLLLWFHLHGLERGL